MSVVDRQIINGVPIYKLDNGEWYCNFDGYKQVREFQNITWSERSFCDWCRKYNITPVG